MTRASMSRRARRSQQQRSMSESNQLPARATVVDPEPLTRYVEREDGLPEMQVIVPGDPPHVATFAPGDRLAFMTGTLVESSRPRAVDRDRIEQLATILKVEPTTRFVFDVNDTVIGYAMIICFDFRSPRFFRDFFAALEANPAAVIEQHRNDPFVALVTAQMEREVLSSMGSPFDDFMTRFRAMARVLHSELRAMVPSGHGDDLPAALFFQHITATARRLRCDLKLPQHDESRGVSTTPFFEFADLMRALLVEQAESLGSNSVRIDQMRTMARGKLIYALERAKGVIKREKSLKINSIVLSKPGGPNGAP
jgi:hypothetical protein